jgi:3-hydroxymyristoyl/3-hydroxydecanoyl-(acyl carrier protein) dehydratase
MFSQVTGLDLYRGITLETELDPQAEPFLRDHALKGIPVLPGVMGIEGFSVTAQHIASVLCSGGEGFRVTALENIRFLTALKFYRKAPRRIVWRASIVREASGLVARVTLESTRALKTGREECTLHFSGRVCLEPLPVQEADIPLARPPVWNDAATVDAEAIYRLYFHGPAFRVLDGVQRVGDRVLGKLQTDLPPATSQGQPLAVTPRLLELCFQTAGIWEAGATGALGLPASIERLVLYKREVGGAPIYAEVKPTLSQDNRPCFDARVVDAQGHLYLELKGYRTSPFPGTIDSARLQPLRALVKEEDA